MWEKRNAYSLLVGKPEGKDHWEDHKSKMDLSEMGLNVVDWIGLAQDTYIWRALVKALMNLLFP
jgi:hypothetical protein